MTTDDLGDPRVFEDEAIREQAARLQLHAGNLSNRLSHVGAISIRTYYRIAELFDIVNELETKALQYKRDDPL